MIRAFNAATDMDEVLAIWLSASNQAHGFMSSGYWAGHLDAMRTQYLPASEVYVFVDTKHTNVVGFFALHEHQLAALFVAPEMQGKGIGQALMAKAKTLRQRITLQVYARNVRSVAFYQQCGFEVIRAQLDVHTGEVERVMQFEQA